MLNIFYIFYSIVVIFFVILLVGSLYVIAAILGGSISLIEDLISKIHKLFTREK